MTEQQEARIMKAARELVAALNSCDGPVTIEHKVASWRMALSEMPRWRHTIDVHFHRTLSVGSDQE